MNPEKDKEMIEHLIKLKTENPDLPIVFMVDYDVCCGEDYGYWQCKIQKVCVDLYCSVEDRIICGKDDIRNELEDSLCDDNKDMADDEFERLVESEYNKALRSKDIQNVIFVYLDN